MAVTLPGFRQAFPEFADTDDTLVMQKLKAAETRIAAGSWGDSYNQGVMYLAAHLLSIAPSGEFARLKKENRVTTYQLEWERMKKEVTMGLGRLA
jgi:hypothetical protein